MKMERIEALLNLSYEDAVEKATSFLLARGIPLAELKGEGHQIAISLFEKSESSAEAIGGFSYIPNRNAYFILQYLRDELDIEVNSFVDLGCGAGNVLFAVNSVFGSEKIVGVEFDSSLCDLAVSAIPAGNYCISVEPANLLYWTPDVNDFDLVYAFEPIRDPEAAEAFWAHLYIWLNDGQLFFYQRDTNNPPAWLVPEETPGLEFPCIYRVNKS